MTSAILPLISSPEPPKPHVSVEIDARRRFPKFQMFESRWPPAPRLPRGGEASHWKRWIRAMEKSRDFPCVWYVWYKYLIFWFEYGDLNFQSMKFPLSISHIFKWRRLDPCLFIPTRANQGKSHRYRMSNKWSWKIVHMIKSCLIMLCSGKSSMIFWVKSGKII